MKKTNELTFLLENNKHNLQSLHDTLGIDFCAPVITFTIDGNFTMKKVLSMCPDDMENYLGAIILTEYIGDYLRCATFDHMGKIKVDYRFCWTKFKSNIDNFYAKVAFEERRKHPTVKAIIILQNTAFLEFPKKRIPDHYADRVVIESDESRPLYKTIRTQTREFIARVHSETGLTSAVDKSGYLLKWRERRLFERWQEYKRNKFKKEYIAINNTVAINELRRLFDQKKTLLQALASKEELTYQDMTKLSSFFQTLAYAKDYFDDLITRENSKSFRSENDFYYQYNSIAQRLNNITL